MQATLYLADDIQSLADNKTLMVGVYTDRVLIAHAPAQAIEELRHGTPLGLPALALMVTISDIEPGEHDGVPRLVLPNGDVSPNRIEPMRFRAPVGGAANLLFKLQPFIITAAGKYTLMVEVDGMPLSVDFEVRLSAIDTAEVTKT